MLQLKMGSARYVKEEAGSVTVLRIEGRLTLEGESANAFGQVVRDISRQNGQTKVLLDLAGVSYIDSTGIGNLVSSFTEVTNRGGQLKLLRLQKRVRDLLQITKLYTVFEVFEDEAAAVRSFS